MNKQIVIGAIVMAASISLSVSNIALADRDSKSDSNSHWGGTFKRASTVPVVSNSLYKTECSACHFAYQPGWLPARSWSKMMLNLEDHFGENAELTKRDNDLITAYLVAEAADNRRNRKSKKILRSIRADAAPLRISTLPYILRKHDEIPHKRLILDNAKVGSAANCIACHTGAEKGQFNEHGVNIPGYGVWED
ncbi:MAG: diheme cytochrome c [Mariprofundaceae bacterium]